MICSDNFLLKYKRGHFDLVQNDLVTFINNPLQVFKFHLKVQLWYDGLIDVLPPFVH